MMNNEQQVGSLAVETLQNIEGFLVQVDGDYRTFDNDGTPVVKHHPAWNDQARTRVEKILTQAGIPVLGEDQISTAPAVLYVDYKMLQSRTGGYFCDVALTVVQRVHLARDLSTHAWGYTWRRCAVDEIESPNSLIDHVLGLTRAFVEDYCSANKRD